MKWGIVLAIINIVLVAAVSGFADRIIYVDADAPGDNDGSSWASAYNFLQDALADADSGAKPAEIRIAQGVYKPDRSTEEPNGTGDRNATFYLIDNVTIKGGFAGFGQADPNARDIEAYESVLSGDLAGNDFDVNDPCDLVDEPTRAENCYHVTTADGTNETTVIDGFTIRNGYAFYTRWHPMWQRSQNRGGGMYNDGGIPLLIDCTFYQNLAEEAGGGMYSVNGANPQLIRCTFTENFATLWGGGILTGLSSPTLTDCLFVRNIAGEGGGINNAVSNITVESCTFIENKAYSYGGGISDHETNNCTIHKCTFKKNHAGSGGGISNSYSSPEVKDCEFLNNKAGYYGGAVWNENSNPLIVNCTIYANKAREGGGIHSRVSNPVILNSIFAGNSASEIGGGIYYGFVREPNDITNCTFVENKAPFGPSVGFNGHETEYTLDNCILRSNDGTSPLWYDINDTTLLVNYSNVQGGWPGEGNIDEDPCFVDPGYWDPNGTPEDANDDFLVNGDYHLKSQAGRWEPISQTWIQDDVTSHCIDAGNPKSSIGTERFPNGGIINMGVYGGTLEASKSYFDAPICETIVAGDINGDCKVDFKDFSILALHWLEEPDQ